jgi:hypothetical protein
MGLKMPSKKFDWLISGDCVEGCTSPPVCPGYWNSPMPAQLHNGQSQCEGVWTFNINQGYYGDVNLAGLLVAYGFNSPSPFPQPGARWKTIIYIDEKANKRQAEALEKVFTLCWQEMGEVLAVKRAKIAFNKEPMDGGSAAKYQVQIEGVYNFAARPFRTADKKPRYINSYWGGHIYLGVSEVNEFHDPGLPRGQWNAPGMSVTYYDFVLNPDKHHWLP